MAFKMKGMSFGKGTSYKSPQKLKAEAAINGSVEHFEKKLEYIKGPKVVKTFK